MTSASDLLFGTAGVPHKTPSGSTLAGIKQASQLGLDCLEVEFVRGIRINSDLARAIKKEARACGVKLSVHAPYYMNLNSPEVGKRLASQERLLASARMAEKCWAENVVFHPGYYGRTAPEKAFQTIKKGIEEVVSILRAERSRIVLRPETMGKKTQFGTLEEILLLCREIEGIKPCIDFSHIHSREGRANRYEEFQRIFRKIEKKLGKKALKNMHIHISGAEYSEKGEMKHIDLRESDFRYDEWIQTLKDLGIEGTVICESPNLEKDALMLKNLFVQGG
ncbi:MAG: TIM barrel protein [Candidatus Aminicenantes bacterium]